MLTIKKLKTNLKIQFVLLLFLFVISCKKKEFTIENISIPKYYTNYDYKEYWRSKGVKFYSSNRLLNDNAYKDSASKHFLKLHFGFANIVNAPKNERANYIKKELGLHLYEINDSYEIYKDEFMESMLPMKGLHFYQYKFISLKDSVEVNIEYCTFDEDKKKLSDFNTIVKQITTALKDKSCFKTNEKKWEPSKVMVN